MDEDGSDGFQRHLGAATETESRFPVRPTDLPEGLGRTQLIGFAVFIGFPILIYVVARLV